MRSKIITGLATFALGALAMLAVVSTGWEREVRSPLIGTSEVELALDRPLGALPLDGVPFDEAVGRLGEAAGVPVEVNWEALRLAGLDLKTPVRLKGQDRTVADALSRACEALNVVVAVRGVVDG